MYVFEMIINFKSINLLYTTMTIKLIVIIVSDEWSEINLCVWFIITTYIKVVGNYIIKVGFVLSFVTSFHMTKYYVCTNLTQPK